MSSKIFARVLAAACVAGIAECNENINFLSPQWSCISLRKNSAKKFDVIPNGAVKFTLDKDFTADLDKVSGKKKKSLDEWIVYNKFTLDKEQNLGFGMGADWWFEAYLNGEKIYSVMDFGNGFSPISPLNHQFAGKGRKGENVLAVLVRRGRASGVFACSTFPYTAVDPEAPAVISGDINNIIGKIKLMNCGAGGPLGSGRDGWSKGPSKTMQDWLEMRIPYVRNHDVALYSSYGGPNVVDIHAVFPDFSKDPTDPASYDFALTDRYMKWMQEGNSKVFYRLGASIEHAPVKYGTKVPPDYKKCAVICEHIIRHYNEGWANGFKMGVEYWEIWNEADISSGTEDKKTWQGTDEQFFEFYRTAAVYLKKKFPKLKIGGPAAAGRIPWVEKFFTAMTKGEKVPFDFFSWHIYCRDPQSALYKAKYFREMLDRYGYKDTESILNEWNYVRSWGDLGPSWKTMRSLKGAAFVSSMMCTGQNSSVDMMMYYYMFPNGSWNGITRAITGEREKPFYSFIAWAKLLDLGKQISLDTGNKRGLYAVGATDGKGKLGILLVNFNDNDNAANDVQVILNVKGVDLRTSRIYALDEKHDFEDVVPFRMNKEGALMFKIPVNSLVYVELQ